MSEESRANPKDEELSAQVQTLFRGETLRGLLLYAWGWSVVGLIAFYTGIAAWLGALAVLIALLIGYAGHERAMRRKDPESSAPEPEREPALV